MAGCISKCHHLGKAELMFEAARSRQVWSIRESRELEMSLSNWIPTPTKPRTGAGMVSERCETLIDQTVD